ncbi:NAD-dependent epimerase/dehydratase family protein [Flavobacterium flavigenum]|uniref:NAD-dependent epimerase/dehydratase family protein n=1 Tax=Flavobacterium flavigenum TaxID=3003258 RepID=UPI0022AC2A83|nr:NAD-dependent epimerase/dehydratase family protein [Flavobacterium flavigenum]
MNIVITGATGFVGRNLQDYLRATCDIKPMSIRYIPNQEFNIMNTGAIIHLAGKAHDLKKVGNPKDYYDSIFELTKQLFDAFLVSDANVFIFMSTVKAIADRVDGVLTEDEIAHPLTHYGIAKFKAEEYILSKELPQGKRIYILRPCMVHGPGNKGNLNLLYKMIARGLPWPLGAFENLRSFLSIENLCFVIKELLENESITSGIYHIADDKPLSTNILVKLLRTNLNKKSNIWSIPVYWIVGITKIGDYLRLPLNSERLQKLTENYVVSNQKIVKAIGKSLPISVEEGIIKTFNSFK